MAKTKIKYNKCTMATVTGFEPIPPESKSGVLPLHYTATYTRLDVSWLTKGELCTYVTAQQSIYALQAYFVSPQDSVLAMAGLEPATSGYASPCSAN